MATSYPGGLDSYTDPTGTDRLDTVDHAGQHTDINDAMEAVQAKVGADSSAVTTSHDYKLSNVTGSDKAVSLTGTETLTNKTLTSPTINLTSDATGDIYYRTAGGAFARLAIGSNTNILAVSASGIPEWITNPDTSDASTTVKGVVEEATQAEYDARTAAGGTSARLFVNPSTVRGILYHDYAASSSGNDTYAITVTPAPTAYTTGDVYVFEPDTANTGAATLNVNSLGAKTIKKKHDQDLADNDIEAGQIVTVVYDGTNFQMQSQTASTEAVSAISGPISHSSTSTENVDDVVTTTFRPKTITVYYDLEANKGSGTDAHSRGVATFNETTIVSNRYDYENEDESTVTGSTGASLGGCVNTAPFAGDGGSNSKVDIQIVSLSDTGFTLRAAFTAGTTWTGAKAYCYAVATA